MGLIGSFFGSDQKKTLAAAKAKSDAALKEGYDQGQGYYNQGYDQLTPYAEGGQAGYNAYNQAIGLGTPEEQAAAQQRIFQDPAMQQILGQQSNALLRKYNSQGSGTGGGRLALAGARVGVENYNNALNRWQGVGQQGAQTATQQSNIRLGQGDLAWGYGASRAGQEVNYGNARAQAQSTGVNNLLSLGGLAIKAGTAFSDVRLKRDIEHIGALPYGLPVYRFRYLDSDQEHIGVMAQEALHYKPEAVAMMDNGYLGVNYAAL